MSISVGPVTVSPVSNQCGCIAVDAAGNIHIATFSGHGDGVDAAANARAFVALVEWGEQLKKAIDAELREHRYAALAGLLDPAKIERLEVYRTFRDAAWPGEEPTT